MMTEKYKMMGYFTTKEEKSRKVVRGVKTVFFLITMSISFLVFSAPLLLVIADAILPISLLSSFSFRTLPSHLTDFDFRYSLIDIPLISILRSAIILCVYSLCDGPRLSKGLYLGITTACSVASLIYVSLKGAYVFNSEGRRGGYVRVRGTEMALFFCSSFLAIAHVVVAYRTSCRERRKLLVYKIDIEAVSACKNGFQRYQKILQQERVKRLVYI